MLFIFRKLRRSFFLPGKLRTYLAYAVGEILLIVIGILIAVQIGDWKERGKLRAYEISILREISSALDLDRELIERALLPRLERKEASIEKALILVSEGAEFSSESFSQLNGMWTDFSYGFNSGPYEALKSAGFERISNELLRRLIINAYASEFPRVQVFIERTNEEANQRIESVIMDIYEERLVTENEKPVLRWAPRDESILSHPSFLTVLMGQSDKADEQRRRLDYTIETLNELKTAVDAELERLTGEPVEPTSNK